MLLHLCFLAPLDLLVGRHIVAHWTLVDAAWSLIYYADGLIAILVLVTGAIVVVRLALAEHTVQVLLAALGD